MKQVKIKISSNYFNFGNVYMTKDKNTIYICCKDDECDSLVLFNCTTLTVGNAVEEYDYDNFIFLGKVRNMTLD